MKNLKFIITFLLLLVLGVGESWGDVDITVRGKAYCAVDKSSTSDVAKNSAKVCVTNTLDEDVIWQNPPYTNNGTKVSVPSSSYVTDGFTLYFHVQPTEGYKFVGWATNAKGVNNDGKSTIVSTERTYKWVGSNKSASYPTTTISMYALLEKDNDVEPTGNGVEFDKIGGTTSYASGSTSKPWSVYVYFQEGLKYDAGTPYSGANADAKKWIKITNTTTKETVLYDNVFVSNGFGILSLPYSMAAGTYNVHLPYGLFTTESNMPTAACDFEVEVTASNVAFELISVSPENNETWEATVTERDNNNTVTYYRDFSFIFNFSKNLTSINTVGKDLALLQSETGRKFPCTNANIGYLDKKQGSLYYGKIPNGHYTLNLPAGVFTDADGNGNEAMTLTFIVTKGEDPFSLPTFEKVTSNPTSGSVEYYNDLLVLKVKFDSETYGRAITTWNTTSGLKATKFVPDNSDEAGGSNVAISKVTSTFVDGELRVTIPTSGLSESQAITVTVPAKYVINKSNASTSSSALEGLYKDGACTNAETAISFTAKRVSKGDVNGDGTIDVTDVTALVNTILGTSRKTNVSDVNSDNNVDVSDVTELVNIILSK